MVIRYLRRPPRPRLGGQATRNNHEPSAAGSANASPSAKAAETAEGRAAPAPRAGNDRSGKGTACPQPNIAHVVPRAP